MASRRGSRAKRISFHGRPRFGVGVAAVAVTVIFISVSAARAVNPASLHPLSGGAARRAASEHATPLAGHTPYHNGQTLVCSDCHVMHASMQHNYAGGEGPEGGIPSFPWEITPTSYLLKATDPLDLCLNCHDNVSGIPDVIDTDVNGLTERSAGWMDGPDASNPRGHDLGRGLDSSPEGICNRCHGSGSPQTAKVTCIDCHNPHGNGNPRNLQWPSNPDATPPLGLFTNPGASGLAAYERANVSYGTLNSVALLEVSSVCGDCHHAFTGADAIDPDGNGIHNRHPVYDSQHNGVNHISDGAARGASDPLHWAGGSGSGFDVQRVPFVVDGATDFASGEVVSGDQDGVFCLSCHKGHGSGSAFGLVWPVNGQVSTTGCDQCHGLAPAVEGGDTSVPILTYHR